MKLSDLYDADERRKLANVRRIAGETSIPHPLNNVQYADGISACRHAKRHTVGQLCNQTVIGPRGPIDRSEPAAPYAVDDSDALNARVIARVWRQGAEPTVVRGAARHQQEVDAILAEALHDAWLRIHVGRLDDDRHARPIAAYQRANTAKHLLDDVWQSLGLSGKIFDKPAAATS